MLLGFGLVRRAVDPLGGDDAAADTTATGAAVLRHRRRRQDTLIVPTILDADGKSLGEISRNARALAGKVRMRGRTRRCAATRSTSCSPSARRDVDGREAMRRAHRSSHSGRSIPAYSWIAP
jgi:hypothetical protein